MLSVPRIGGFPDLFRHRGVGGGGGEVSYASKLLTTMTVSTDGLGDQRLNLSGYQRAHALASYRGIQLFPYYDDSANLQIGYRQLHSTTWTSVDSAENLADNTDTHHVIGFGVDDNDRLWVMYEIHNDAPNLWRSTNDFQDFLDSADTTSVAHMGLNDNGANASYPVFLNGPDGSFHYMWRQASGATNPFWTHLFTYNHGTTTWANATGTVTANSEAATVYYGGGLSPDEIFYSHYRTAFDSDFGSGGDLHFTGYRKEDSAGANENKDIVYFKWNGTNFRNAAGTTLTLPINRDTTNLDVVDTSSHVNEFAQGAVAADSSGNAHIVYQRYPNTTYTNGNFYYRRWNGSAWVGLDDIASWTHTLSHVTDPDIVVDPSNDTVYILAYRPSGTLYLYTIESPYTTATETELVTGIDSDQQSLHVDRNRWRDYGILSLPFADWETTTTPEPIRVYEWTPGLRLQGAYIHADDRTKISGVFTHSLQTSDFTTGWTINKDDVGQTINSASKSGDTVTWTLSAAAAAGTAVDVSYDSGTGNVTGLADINNAPVAQPLAQTLTQQPASADTRLISDTADTNYGTNTSLSVGDSTTGADRAQASLLKFDLSSIPAGAQITSVQLQLNEWDAQHDGGTGSPFSVNLHRCLVNWIEAEATWNIYSTGNNWTTAGAKSDGNDRVAAVSATLSMDGTAAAGFVTWGSHANLVADVQGWVDGTFANYGWVLESPSADNPGVTEKTHNTFRSSDYATGADRPKLIVAYESN